jgi:hypothetical protein
MLGRFVCNECSTAFQNVCRFSKECDFGGTIKGAVESLEFLPLSAGNTAAEASSGNIVTVANLMVLGLCSKTVNFALGMAIAIEGDDNSQSLGFIDKTIKTHICGHMQDALAFPE